MPIIEPSHNEPTITDLKALQRRLGILDQHVVWIGPSRFVIAHSDEERATADLGGDALEACDLHGWLVALDGPPAEPGYYVAMPHEPDAYSEPYGAARWDFDAVPVIERHATYYLTGYVRVAAFSDEEAERKIVDALGNDVEYEIADDVVLCFEGPWDAVEPADEPDCICPPDLLARGGFKGGCPVHRANAR